MADHPMDWQLMGHALRHVAGNSPQTEIMKRWVGYRSGGPRIYTQSPHRLDDINALTDHLIPKNPHELRRSSPQPQPQPEER